MREPRNNRKIWSCNTVPRTFVQNCRSRLFYPVYYFATRMWQLRMWKSYSSPSWCCDAELAAERDWTCWRHCLTLCWCTPSSGGSMFRTVKFTDMGAVSPKLKIIVRNTYSARTHLPRVMFCFVSLMLLLLLFFFLFFFFFFIAGKGGWCCLTEQYFCTFPLFGYTKEQSFDLFFSRPWWLYRFS